MIAPVQNYILFMDSWYEFLNSVYAEVYFADNWSPMTMTISHLGESRVASMALNCFVTSWVTAMLRWVKFKIKKNDFAQRTEPNKRREINLFVCICAQSVQIYM